jgi:hypothetical protein
MPSLERLSAAAVLAGLLGTIVACDEDNPYQADRNRRAEQQRALNADKALLLNITQADTEFRRRLRERLTTRDGAVILRELYASNLGTVVAFPISTPWSISCGPVGISIIFGTGGSEEGGNFEVRISEALLSIDQCSQVVPSLAHELAADLASGSLDRQSTAREAVSDGPPYRRE